MYANRLVGYVLPNNITCGAMVYLQTLYLLQDSSRTAALIKATLTHQVKAKNHGDSVLNSNGGFVIVPFFAIHHEDQNILFFGKSGSFGILD